MVKRDIEAIEHVKAIMDYCNEHENCKGKSCEKCWNEVCMEK